MVISGSTTPDRITPFGLACFALRIRGRYSIGVRFMSQAKWGIWGTRRQAAHNQTHSYQMVRWR